MIELSSNGLETVQCLNDVTKIVARPQSYPFYLQATSLELDNYCRRENKAFESLSTDDLAVVLCDAGLTMNATLFVDIATFDGEEVTPSIEVLIRQAQAKYAYTNRLLEMLSEKDKHTILLESAANETIRASYRLSQRCQEIETTNQMLGNQNAAHPDIAPRPLLDIDSDETVVRIKRQRDYYRSLQKTISQL